MAAPIPIPTRLKVLRGNPGRRPLRPEPEPAPLSEPPEPPAFLIGYAAEEWRRAARDPVTHGLLVRTADGNPRRNPLQKIASDAALDMLRFANEIGIGPAARARIAAGWQPPEP